LLYLLARRSASGIWRAHHSFRSTRNSSLADRKEAIAVSPARSGPKVADLYIAAAVDVVEGILGRGGVEGVAESSSGWPVAEEIGRACGED
jgi:hypothetical protein